MLKFIVKDVMNKVVYEGASSKEVQQVLTDPKVRVPKVFIYNARTNDFIKTLSKGYFRNTFYRCDFDSMINKAKNKAISVKPRSFSINRVNDFITVPRSGKLSHGKRFKIYSTTGKQPVYGMNNEIAWKAYKLHYEYQFTQDDKIIHFPTDSVLVFISETSFIVIPEAHFNRFFNRI